MKRFVVVLAALVAATVLLLAGVRRFLVPGALAATDPRRGREVFWGRGACSSCHSVEGEGGGTRGPRLGWDLFDPRQERGGLSPIEYVVQSVYEPAAQTAPGFPAGLMPTVRLPPISLDDDDILAVLTYLFTETRPGEKPPVAELRRAQRRFGHTLPPAGRGTMPKGDAARGRVAYQRLWCRACHQLAADPTIGDRLGPALDGIGRYQSAAYLAQSVVDPSAVLVPGGYVAEDGHTSRMPTYVEVLEPGELEDLVAFLETCR